MMIRLPQTNFEVNRILRAVLFVKAAVITVLAVKASLAGEWIMCLFATISAGAFAYVWWNFSEMYLSGYMPVIIRPLAITEPKVAVLQDGEIKALFSSPTQAYRWMETEFVESVESAILARKWQAQFLNGTTAIGMRDLSDRVDELLEGITGATDIALTRNRDFMLNRKITEFLNGRRQTPKKTNEAEAGYTTKSAARATARS